MQKRNLPLRLFAILVYLALTLTSTSALADFSLPEGLTVIEDEAFLNDISLTGLLVLPNSVENVGNAAFDGTGLYALELPSGVERIGVQHMDSYAYVYLHGSTDVDASLISSARYVFATPGTQAANLAAQIGATCIDPADLILADGFYYRIADGAAELLCARNASLLPSSIVIPETVDGTPVTAISSSAFFGCQHVTALSLPISAAVADEALSGCPNAEVEVYGIRIDSIVPDLGASSYIAAGEGASWLVSAVGASDRAYTYTYTLTFNGEACQSGVVENAGLTLTIATDALDATGSCQLSVTMSDGVRTTDAVSAVIPVYSLPDLQEIRFTGIAAIGNELTWELVTTVDVPDTFVIRQTLTYQGQICAESSLSTLTYTPAEAGEYTLTSEIIDPDGTLICRRVNTCNVLTSLEPVIDAITPDVSEEIYAGDSITWSVSASGGFSPYKYAYRAYLDGVAVGNRTSYSASDTFTLNDLLPGVYTLEVSLRDDELNVVTLTGGAVTVNAPVVTQLDANSGMPFTDEEVTWTMAVRGTLPGGFCRMSLYQADADTAMYTVEGSVMTYALDSAGDYTVVAEYLDAEGAVISSKTLAVPVTWLPVVITDVISAQENWYLYDTNTWFVAFDTDLGLYVYDLTFRLLCDGAVVAESTGNSLSFTHTFAQAGSYTLVIDITAPDGTLIFNYEDEAPHIVTHAELILADNTVSPNTCFPGDIVRWTYAVENALERYTGVFELLLDGECIARQTASCTTDENGLSMYAFSHTFTDAGEYNVVFRIVDGETTLYELTGVYTVSIIPLAINSVTPDVTEPFVYEPITWAVSASGGVEPYTYAYILYRDGEEVDFVGFGSESTYTYTPDVEGAYILEARVRDSQRTVCTLTTEPVQVLLRPLAILNTKASQTRIKLGESVTFTVSAQGGRLPLSYACTVTGDTGVKVFDSGALTEGTAVWTPEVMGNYSITFTVTDADGTFITSDAISIRVYDQMRLSGLAADVEQVRACNDVTWTVTRTDGRVNCTYTWAILDDGVTETTIETTEPTLVYAPQGMGTYTVTVTADDGCETKSLTGGEVDVLHRYNTELPYSICVGTYAINGTYTGTDPYVVIPPSINGNQIGRILKISSNLITTLEIGDHIYTLYPGSISCPNLTSVTLPKSWSTADSTDDSMKTYGPFSACSKLTTITVPEGATYLPRVAFAETPALRTVNLPGTLTGIGPLAFYNCGSLSSISIPAGVTSIGSHAFAGTAITHVDLPAGWNAVPSTYGDWYNDFYGSSPFADSNVSSVTLDPAMTAIPNFAFDDATALTSITLHEGITSIGNYAFKNCTSLPMLTIPDSVTSIGLDAFAGCNEHFYIRCNPGSYAEAYCIKNGVSYVSEYEFTVTNDEVTITKYTGSMEVEQITVPAYIAGYPVTKIEGVYYVEVFPETGDMKPSITFPDTLRTVGSCVFYVCDLTTLDLGSGVTTLYSDFISVNLHVVNLSLPESLTNYVIVSQYDYISIDNLTLPATMTAEQFIAITKFLSINDSITVAGGEHLKMQDSMLMTADGTTMLRYIGDGDFIIPDTATTIESNAVRYNYFYEITVPDSVTTIRSDAFTHPQNVLFHCSATSAAETFAKSNGANTINHFTYTIADDACTISAYKGPLKAITLPPRISGCPVTDIGTTFQGSAITSINMRDTSITTIADCAFQSCTSLTSVTLPIRTLTIIGESAFRGCTALTEFYISNHVTDLGDYALADCTALSTIGWVRIGGDPTPFQLKRLGSYAFRNCVSLTRFTMIDSITGLGMGVFSGSGLQTVTLSPNLTAIPAYTFYYTDLTKIVIPDSVTSIGNYAFSYSKLTKIWIPGSVTYISASAFANLPNKSVAFWLQSTVSTMLFNKIASLGCAYSVGRSSSLPNNF